MREVIRAVPTLGLFSLLGLLVFSPSTFSDAMGWWMDAFRDAATPKLDDLMETPTSTPSPQP